MSDAEPRHFATTFKPVYDELVRAPRTVAEAVQMCLRFEHTYNLRTPRIYASTAITSAGFKRVPGLDLAEVIRLNNETAAELMGELAAGGSPGIYAPEVMLPTELGKISGWEDSDYIAFYCAWLTGLSAEATSWIEGRLADPLVADIASKADDRTKSNEERWPYYALLVEVLLTNLAVVEHRRGARVQDACITLLQLVDTTESLGCRAETLYAEARGLDIVTVTHDITFAGPLQDKLARLEEVGVVVGTKRTPVQLAALILR